MLTKSPSLRHLNTLFLGIDGCFKTKLKDRGINDPDLGTGLAYMVNDVDYAAHIEETEGMTLEKEVITFMSCAPTTYLFPVKDSTCGSDLHAVNQAYTRNSKGYLVTGVVAISCRHSFVRPTGVVDLQKGEK
jgi:hypothetical protein